MSWNRVKLGDIAKFLSGGTPSKQRPEYWGGNIPWVSAKDLKGTRIFDSQLYVTEDGVMNGTKMVPENTILFVVRGMSLAKEFRISLTKVPVAFNQDLKALFLKDDIDPYFVFYALYAKREHIKQLAGDASHGTKKLPTEVIECIDLKLPDYITQIKVGQIASQYDDLIENNRRRIQLLEESARLLYKEWFVRLRFPGHEHVAIVDGIPEGWEQKTVGELSSFLSRGITPKYDDEAPGIVINQKCIRNRLLNLQLARHQKKEVPKNKLVRFGDILINSTGTGTLGRVSQVFESLENCTVDSHVTIIRPEKSEHIFYLGLLLASMEAQIAEMGRGATNQTELSKASISEILALVPPKSLVLELSSFATKNFQQITTLVSQSEKLKQARDLLLPRLMNGEIAV